nr:EOG090X0J9J [Lepidurus arcticus]
MSHADMISYFREDVPVVISDGADDWLALSPKRGPTTLSKTSSFEALDPHDPTLNKLAVNMFQKTASYLEEELSVTQEEYKLLQNMNRITATKYADMAHLTSSVGSALSILNEKYQGLQPYLDQIDQIEDSVAQLEQAAYKLDAYTKRLEAKFKSLEKR